MPLKRYAIKFDEGGNFTEEYAMPFILWSLYIFLDYFLNEKVSGLRILLCGGMFAFVDSYWMLASLGIIFYVVAAELDRKKKYVTIDAVLENSAEDERITVWGNLDSIYVSAIRIERMVYG